MLTQLQDCEDLKEDLDPEEYEETRQDTLQQLREFQNTLTRMTSGNNTLISQFGSVQLVGVFLALVSSCSLAPRLSRLLLVKPSRHQRLSNSLPRRSLDSFVIALKSLR